MRRFGVMVLTMLSLTMIVFYMVNLEPNLRKLALNQIEMRSSDEQIESWLSRQGYRQNILVRYAQWLGVIRKQPIIDPATHKPVPRFSYCGE
ncbi:MAG: ABC transporter permease, partial [Mesorhizobium sp.]